MYLLMLASSSRVIRNKMLPTLHSSKVCLCSVHKSNIRNRAINKLNAYRTGIDQQDYFSDLLCRSADTRSLVLKTSQLLEEHVKIQHWMIWETESIVLLSTYRELLGD